MFCVSCCLLHHLFFAWVGAAVFRFGLFAAGFVMRFCGVLPGAHRCFGCGFLMPHLSAKSGCFGEYLNVFAGFLFRNVGINRVLHKMSAMDF